MSLPRRTGFTGDAKKNIAFFAGKKHPNAYFYVPWIIQTNIKIRNSRNKKSLATLFNFLIVLAFTRLPEQPL